MHSYYRTIGFSGSQSKNIIRNIINKAIKEYIENNDDDIKGKLIEIYVMFDDEIGLTIHGEFLENKNFEVEYSFPFLKPQIYEVYQEIAIEKNVANYSFSASCDNPAAGISVIFYLQNALSYVNLITRFSSTAKVGLAALSLKGKIIMPNSRPEEYDKIYVESKKIRNNMINEAKNGNEEAMENLTLEEMNLYSKISKRIVHEDVLTIVDTSFMPYGIECDCYSVIGKILEIKECSNRITAESLYNFTIECNDVIMNVLINKKDLLGEPRVGRRFKGNIWLQGNIKFVDA